MRPAKMLPLLKATAALDAVSKGIGEGNPWDELRSVALALAGTPAVPLAASPG